MFFLQFLDNINNNPEIEFYPEITNTMFHLFVPCTNHLVQIVESPFDSTKQKPNLLHGPPIEERVVLLFASSQAKSGKLYWCTAIGKVHRMLQREND
jgi:hypothetical protein